MGLLQPEDHPTERRTTVLRCSILADGGTLPLRTPSAAKRADTAAVLADLGCSASAVLGLIDRRAAVAV